MMNSAKRYEAATRGGAARIRTIELGPGTVKSFTPDGCELTLICIDGAVWATQAARDVILRSGERLTSGGIGRVVIEPVDGRARIGVYAIAPAAPVDEGWIERLRLRLRTFFAERSGARPESYCN